MKKIIALLMVLFVVFSSSFASANAKSDKTPTGIIQTQNVTSVICDATNKAECDVAEMVAESTNVCLTAPAALQCTVKAKVKATFHCIEIEVEATVSGDCSDLKALASRLAAKALAEVKAAVMEYLY